MLIKRSELSVKWRLWNGLQTSTALQRSSPQQSEIPASSKGLPCWHWWRKDTNLCKSRAQGQPLPLWCLCHEGIQLWQMVRVDSRTVMAYEALARCVIPLIQWDESMLAWPSLQSSKTCQALQKAEPRIPLTWSHLWDTCLQGNSWGKMLNISLEITLFCINLRQWLSAYISYVSLLWNNLLDFVCFL